MYLQELVEVAIGLVFAWLLLSIAILQIQEIIAGWISKRSTDLYGAIKKMLSDQKALDEFYKHPLIESLKTPPGWLKKKLSKTELNPQNPSYIPAETFARALFDIVTKAGTKDSLITTAFTDLREIIEGLEKADQKAANDLIAYLINLAQTHASTQINNLKTDLRKEMLIKLTELEGVGTDNQGHQPLKEISKRLRILANGNQTDELAVVLRNAEPYLSQVRNGLLTHGSKQLGEALNSLLAGVEEYATSTDKALAIGRKNVEKWFDNSMERLSGGYKRWAQTLSFMIAFVVALAFNIDSIQIARELWRNPAMRQASATYIDNFVKEKTKDGSTLSNTDLGIINTEIQKLAYPVGWGTQRWDPEKDASGKIETNEKGLVICKPSDSPNPIYIWGGKCTQIKNLPDSFLGWLIKIMGFLLTAGAAMQGAPFWFDTLKKLVNIRSTGVNPAEKPKESTSDKER